MIKVRQYGRSCNCQKKNDALTALPPEERRGGYIYCNHPADVPLDKWYFHKPQGCKIAALYTDMANVRRSLPHARKNRRGSPNETKIVYFESDDLLELTEDMQLAFEQAEAKMVKAAERAEELRKAT